VAKAYRKHLFGDATLQELPDFPRFIINATHVQSGVLWRFMKPYMRDYKVGEVRQPRVALALAVSASSAFPPFLSPAHLPLDSQSFTPGNEPLHKPPFTTRAVLTDGGVYDNLGLETIWKRCKTVFVSDGGGQMNAEPKPRRDWVRHAKRVGDIVDNQVRSLRKRQVVQSYEHHLRAGAYWGIRTSIADYGAGVRLNCSHEKTLLLANVKTRLAKLDSAMQERLINWGYAVCDAALRRYFDPNLLDPAGFPFPRGVE
jgi:NTE family protein